LHPSVLPWRKHITQRLDADRLRACVDDSGVVAGHRSGCAPTCIDTVCQFIKRSPSIARKTGPMLRRYAVALDPGFDCVNGNTARRRYRIRLPGITNDLSVVSHGGRYADCV